MSRYRIAMIAALALCVLDYHVVRSGWLAGIALFVFVVLTSFGVALPHWNLFGAFICRGETTEKKVALTFDDGPDPSSTPALLDLLRVEGVKATFFCIGHRVDAHPKLAARIASEGHEIGNHTHAHSNLTNFYFSWMLKADILRGQRSVERATGIQPMRFRPPMGLSNPALFFVTRRLKLPVIGWTARGFDTRVQEPERVVARIVSKLSPGGIILLHDGGIPRERLLTTVTALLAELKKSGYQVVPLAELLS